METQLTHMATQTTETPGAIDRAKTFVHDVRNELGKVNWPTQNDLKSSTTVVFIFLALLGIIVGAMDLVLQNVVLWLFRLT